MSNYIRMWSDPGFDLKAHNAFLSIPGSVIVALDACSGFKPFMMDIKENTKDTIRAFADWSLTE